MPIGAVRQLGAAQVVRVFRGQQGPVCPTRSEVPSKPAYPLFVVIPKDDVIPKFSFSGILRGILRGSFRVRDLEISRDSA